MAGSVVDDPEFSGVFEQYREKVCRYVMGLVRDSAEAEDITQETFLRAYRKLSSVHDKKWLSAWLYRIATNLCYDRFRRVSYKVHTQSLEVLDTPAGGELSDSATPRLDRVFEQKEMSACIQEYLEELPDTYRAVILLHDMEGLTNLEIAEMLDCSLATAKIRLHRARIRLNGVLGDACRFTRDDRGVTICPRVPVSLTKKPVS